MRFVLVLGTTRTAAIDGISAAGADPDAMVHTPGADAELVAYGRPVFAPGVPVSPSGTPTPALVTRAVRELVGFDLLALEAGLAASTGAPTVTVGDEPGGDVRQPVAVRDAESVMEAARRFARSLTPDEVVIAETIPGGTTTALGVLRALGEPYDVSSSMASNPLDLKREVVAEGLAASDLAAGEAADQPTEAIRSMGDPVLAAVAGFLEGANEGGTDVTLAGGTQLLAAAALCRHAGIDGTLKLATTPFLAADPAIDLSRAAEDLTLDVTVTDPAFDQRDHPALAGYRQGEAKEGVGMGGALHLADQRDVPMGKVRDRIIQLYGTLVDQHGS